jgi:hypothetical protein
MAERDPIEIKPMREADQKDNRVGLRVVQSLILLIIDVLIPN